MPDTAEAVAQYGSAVYRLAYAMTRSRSDADDVFQEVFLRLHRSAPGFASEEHRRAWLLRVTANCAKSLLASPWRRRTLPLEDVYAYTDPDASAVDEAMAALLSALPEGGSVSGEGVAPRGARREGIEIPSDVGYAAMGGLSGEFDGRWQLAGRVVSLQYLWNAVRVQGGAYGTGMVTRINGFDSSKIWGPVHGRKFYLGLRFGLDRE